jgi:hypothetical protein
MVCEEGEHNVFSESLLAFHGIVCDLGKLLDLVEPLFLWNNDGDNTKKAPTSLGRCAYQMVRLLRDS